MASLSDAEDETEEILLFAEIDGLLCTEILEHDSICVPTFKIVGLDTDKPYMQIGKETFEGEYQDRIGSALFFEKDSHPAGDDPTFRKVPENPLRYFGKTDKNLCLNRVFLKSKKEPEQKEVLQPVYIDSKDIEALAATEKEYTEMLATFKEANVVEGISSNLQESDQVTVNQEGKSVTTGQTQVTEGTQDIPSTSNSEPVVISTSKPVKGSAVPISDTSALAEVSQLICEQMDVDVVHSLQPP